MPVHHLLIHLLAQIEQPQVPLEELGPPRNMILLMALLGIVLLGIALVAGIMIGARWVRNLAATRPRKLSGTSADQQAAFVHSLEKQLPKGNSGETIVADQPTDDTISD